MTLVVVGAASCMADAILLLRDCRRADEARALDYQLRYAHNDWLVVRHDH